MAVRVTQMMKFTNFVNNMNFSLDKLMELNEKASSQKKVNRPSDAPVATAQILQYRNNISSIDQYSRNADVAKGWLSMADSTLTQVNTVLTRVRELAEQAATGTMSKANREQVGYEVRQLFEQLIVLSNTEYEDQQIFAGHKTSEQAFNETMAVTSNDPGTSQNFQVNGLSDKTVLVQFLEDGVIGSNAGGIDYRYSRDGGDTWTNATLASNANILDLGGVQVTMETGSNVLEVDTSRTDVSVEQDGTPNGTWLWVRPAAIYGGDFEDTIEVDRFGADSLAASAQGFFKQDVMVRIDNTSTTSLASNISYSYSLDRGISWITGNNVSNAATPNSASLPVPGGFLEIASNGGNQLNPGEQFIIRPQRANIYYEISPGERLSVNNIGKDVFGGIYKESPCASNCTAAMGGGAQNMFEVVGRLVGYIETNNQSGIQQGLEDLGVASEHVLTAAANVGARENRLEVATNMLTSLRLNKSERLSQIEDADISELMTQLAQQQIVYESVLKSSSMIMRMSLLNYV